jgi:hypothetical protein
VEKKKLEMWTLFPIDSGISPHGDQYLLMGLLDSQGEITDREIAEELNLTKSRAQTLAADLYHRVSVCTSSHNIFWCKRNGEKIFYLEERKIPSETLVHRSWKGKKAGS